MKEWNFGRGKGTKNRVAYTCGCEWCGILFPAKRPDATTCSNAHRLQWTRWARKFLAKYKRKPARGPRGDASYKDAVRSWYYHSVDELYTYKRF